MACVQVPQLGRPGRRLQEVREYRTTTASLLAGFSGGFWDLG
jgi:hypothetical protein